MTKHISIAEVQMLYIKYETPANVIAHCKAVSYVGEIIADDLNHHGYHLDTELVKMAGMAHDVMRKEEHHGEAIASVLKDMGYSEEADVIRNHMHYDFNDFDHLNETDIMCLADRVVKEDKYVGIDERVDYLINKPGKTPERTKILLEKKELSKEFIHKIEESIGQSLDSLFGSR